MKQWWNSLEQREQRLVSIAAPFVTVCVIYWGLWQPLQDAKLQAERDLVNRQNLLSWMTRNGELILAAPQAKAPSQAPLNQVLTRLAQRQKIELARVETRSDGLDVWIESSNYNQFLELVYLLDKEYRIQVKLLELEKQDQAGHVRIRRLRLGQG